MSRGSSRGVVLFAAVVLMVLGVGVVATAQEVPTADIHAKLLPLYLSVKNDAKLLAMDPGLDGRLGDAAAVDRFLELMPLSPLEYLQIDMEVNRYEIAVPRFMQELHVRWIEINTAVAREQYGDTYVDQVLTRWPADTGRDAVVPEGGPLLPTVGTNRNVASTASPAPTAYDGEIQIAVNHRNPNQMVAAANTWGTAGAACNNDETQSVFYSGDGGATWFYTCAPSNNVFSLGTCRGSVFGSDPALFWNDNNEVFLNYMLLCATATRTLYAMVVARSADGGATWSKQGIIKNAWSTRTLEDKNFYAIDITPTSPYYGRHYTCWDRSNNEKFAYSSNNGLTFTEVDLPSAPSGGVDLGCEIAVGKNGTVHVVFDSLTCGSSCTNEQMFYTRSTNGGASWSSPVMVRDFNLVGFSGANTPPVADYRGIGPFGAIDIDNSGGTCDGTMYATFCDWSSGGATETDVWVSRSTTNGASWSAPVKVNDDGLAGRTQFHPFLQVDQSTGNVIVAWHDARNDPNNRKVDFYAARSTNCGVSFEANVKVSQPSAEFNNSGISTTDENTTDNPNRNPNQYGEYMGLDAESGKAYVAWTDSRHFFPGSSTEPQKENVGFATVDFSGGTGPVCGNDLVESGEVCDGTDLGGQTCVSQGFTGGTLACNSTCSAFVTTGCTSGAVCGNNVIESPEVCDGTNLGGQTCIDLGFDGGTLACGGTCSAFNTSGCTTGGPTTVTFTSVAAQDGYVLESSETSNSGGTVSSTATTTSAIRVGDDRKDRQYKGFVSFDTSSIPDGATIQSVTLRLRRGTLSGTNPFTTHGAMTADVSSAFGGSTALASGDFQAAASATAVCSLSNAASNGSWSECTFNAAGLAAVNAAGATQVRVQFALDDNDDRGNDYLGYYSGDNSTAGNRPQLVVTYQ